MMFKAVMGSVDGNAWDGNPPVFATTGEAWHHLATERIHQEDAVDDPPHAYSRVLGDLELYAACSHGEGVITGYDPADELSHEIWYAVVAVE